MRQLAADSGLSYDVLRSWRSGRRRPNADSVRKLADGLARRSDVLRDLARDLRKHGPQPPHGAQSPHNGQTQQAAQPAHGNSSSQS